MRNQITILAVLFFFIFTACEKEDVPENYSFEGKVQKGPFIAGTNLTINELNSALGQTGRTFTASILSDDGSFALHNIELTSRHALLTANGFYFNEIYGTQSSSALTLAAISDLENQSTVNINIMNHLIRERILKLVGEGETFPDAREQAQSELRTFLGVDDLGEELFDHLDISEDSDANALLLATSVMVQRFTNWSQELPTLTAELTWLLAMLGSDLGDNGIIDGEALIDTLLHNISRLNLLDIRENIEMKYAALGKPASIPEFEEYIWKFQEKHSDIIYNTFTYPAMATPEFRYPDAKVPNILVPSDTVFQAGMAYSIAAIVPLGSTLTIKFISDNADYNYVMGGLISGWLMENHYPDGFTFHSQRCNDLMTLLFHLDNPGEASIEYYENGAESPSFTKKIRWENTHPDPS